MTAHFSVASDGQTAPIVALTIVAAILISVNLATQWACQSPITSPAPDEMAKSPQGIAACNGVR